MKAKCPQPALPATREDIWNGWTRNYSRREDGYITHAFSESQCRKLKALKSLCGVQLQDSGLLNLGANPGADCLANQPWIPGCKKCTRILRKLGLGPVIDEVRGRLGAL